MLTLDARQDGGLQTSARPASLLTMAVEILYCPT
jgi:hypothetical protein